MITETAILVRYAETDRMGIVHHSNYPVWYEAARGDYIRSFGLSYKEMEERGALTPLLEVGCRFKRPAGYDDQLTVTARLAMLSGVKLRFEYEIYRADSEKPINTGYTLHAFTDRNLRPLNAKKHLPDIYKALFASLEPPVF